MKINVYDDYKSLVHFVAGFILPIIPWLFPFILAYEVIEYHLKKGEEPVQNFIGDLYEVGFGCMIGIVFFKMIGLV